MEDDTELRDLVVQTLENNGVLAKVRAELRASVFLALEEQESVMNPEPLLNKTVKQYLANAEGKLLFSLVREFLEYFGLDYTISVYDPETYFGKEYNYVGRSKLCEELGIESNEPLLGEILKNRVNSAFNNTQKIQTSDNGNNERNEFSSNAANTTFEVSVPKVLHNETVSFGNNVDSLDKLGNMPQASENLPSNVTITERKNQEAFINNIVKIQTNEEIQGNFLRESVIQPEYTKEKNGIDNPENNNVRVNKLPPSPNGTNTVINHKQQETEVDTQQNTLLNETEPLIKFDESIVSDVQKNQNDDLNKQNSINSMNMQTANNVQNKKFDATGNSFGKAVYFDEIIVDGKKENISTIVKDDSFLQDLPPLQDKPNSIFGDLPPLNGKKPNINDLKELMNIGLENDGIGNYEDDFVSSASGSANDRSPCKDSEQPLPLVQPRVRKQDKSSSARSDDVSEEIDMIEDLPSTTSCVSKSDEG